QRRREDTNDLMDKDQNASGLLDAEASRLAARIDPPPLAAPVIPDFLVPMDVPTVHPVRPLHLRVHRGQGPIDVPGVERVVRSGEKSALVVSQGSSRPFWRRRASSSGGAR